MRTKQHSVQLLDGFPHMIKFITFILAALLLFLWRCLVSISSTTMLIQYLQVKGTTMANYIDVTYGTKDVMSTKRCVSFSLDTGLLHLVERVGNSLPILLVVVDLSSKNAYPSRPRWRWNHRRCSFWDHPWMQQACGSNERR